MKTKIVLIIALPFFLFANICVAQKGLKFAPLSCDKFPDINSALEKVLILQKSKYAPLSYEITEEYMRWSREKVKSVWYADAYYVGRDVKTVYFEHITNLHIEKARQGWEVVFKAINDKYYFHLIYVDKNLAIESYSALKCKIESMKH